MPFLARLSSLVKNLLDRDAVERELEDELESYLGLLVEEKERNGITPQEARRQVLAEMGGKTSVKERVRERRIGYAFDTFTQDLRYGVRMLGRTPGFTLLAISILGLGIAASTAVYSVVDGVLLRSLPYPEPERLVFIAATARDGRQNFSPPDFVDFREQSRSFEAIGAVQGQALVSLSIDGRPEPVRTRDVTTNFLSVYGVEPYLGRSFTREDDDVVAFEDWGNPDVKLPPSVILISYEFWQKRFGGDPAVLGKPVEIDFQPYVIIGVTPPHFRTLLPDEGDYSLDVDVWSLSRMDFPRMPRDASFLRVVGRLKPGVTISQAQAEAELFAERQRSRHAIHREAGYEVQVTPLHQSLTSHHSESIWMLFGAVGFLLFIACANLANLLLTRSVARERELAVRMALGAGRARLVRQLLTESLLYALLGVGLGLPLAQGLIRGFVGWAPGSIPRIEDISIDGPVLAFALVSSLIAATLVALVPALRMSREREQVALQRAGRVMAGMHPQAWDRVIVVAEVAISVVLVIGTALLLASLVALLEVEPGFEPDHVLTAEMNLPSRHYPRYPRADARVRFARQATERISRLPGVDHVALALVVPLSRQDAGHTYGTEEMLASSPVLPPAKYRPVTPGYFRTVGTQLLAGRDFNWNDLEQYRLVSIVDERLARRAWPEENPIGQRLRIETWSTTGGRIHLEPLWTEVIGVAENVRSAGLGRNDPETVYLPYGLYAVSELSLLVRSSSEPSALTSAIREQFGQLDPGLAVFNFRLMDDFVADSVAPQRFSLNLLSAFGTTGLVLALIGVYGVLSHAVSLRRREIGIRMALGAGRGDVRKQVLASGAGSIAAGIGLGLLGASGLTRLLASQLYGVSPLDGRIFSGVATLTFLVGLAACYFPARRASEIDPIETLRLE